MYTEEDSAKPESRDASLNLATDRKPAFEVPPAANDPARQKNLSDEAIAKFNRLQVIDLMLNLPPEAAFYPDLTDGVMGIHEASHAVVGIYLGMKVEFIEMCNYDDDSEGESSAVVRFHLDRAVAGRPPVTRRCLCGMPKLAPLEPTMLTDIAGYEGEKIYGNRFLKQLEKIPVCPCPLSDAIIPDYVNLVRRLSVFLNPAEAWDYYKVLRKVCRQILRRTDVRQAIHDLAKLLTLYRENEWIMSGKDAERLIKASFRYIRSGKSEKARQARQRILRELSMSQSAWQTHALRERRKKAKLRIAAKSSHV